MNNLLNNKWITVIITKLQVAPVELDVSRQSSSTCRASRTSRARRVERVELCCSTSSTQPKCMGSTRRMCRVESSGIWAYVSSERRSDKNSAKTWPGLLCILLNSLSSASSTISCMSVVSSTETASNSSFDQTRNANYSSKKKDSVNDRWLF